MNTNKNPAKYELGEPYMMVPSFQTVALYKKRIQQLPWQIPGSVEY